MNIELAIPDDYPLDLPIGAVVRLAPVHDMDGTVLGFALIDDARNKIIDLLPVEFVRVTRE